MEKWQLESILKFLVLLILRPFWNIIFEDSPFTPKSQSDFPNFGGPALAKLTQEEIIKAVADAFPSLTMSIVRVSFKANVTTIFCKDAETSIRLDSIHF